MTAFLEHVPLDAGGVEGDRLVVAEDEQPVAEWLELDRDLAELRPRSELEPGNAAAGEHPHERRAVLEHLPPELGPGHIAFSIGPLEPIGDRHARPAGLDGHRPRAVALAEREALAFGRDREVSGPRPAQNVGEDGRRVGSRMAQPRHPGIRREQRDRRSVREHRVPLDRNGVIAVEPVPAQLEHEAEHPHRVDRLVDVIRRKRLAGPDLDPEVRPVELGECVLVRDVVPEEEDGAGRRLHAQRGDGRTLVGREERELDDLLAVGDVDVRPGRRPAFDSSERLLAHLPAGAAQVHRNARGLRLEADAGEVADDRRQLREQLVVEIVLFGCEPLDEPEVELRAVAADQVHLAREAGEGREVAQRATGDHGDDGLGKRSQRPDGCHGLGQRPGGRGVVDERSERSVVVAADQQLRHARDVREGGAQFGVEAAVRHDLLRPLRRGQARGSRS